MANKKIKSLCQMAAILFFFNGCATTVSLHLKPSTVPGKMNQVTYYTGFARTLNHERIVLFIRGTGRFPASADFGMGAEVTWYGFSVVYPQKSYVEDEKQYLVHDHRLQRMHDLNTIMNDLIAQGARQVLLLADSEGTMLAPEIAAQYHQVVCGMVCMGGSLFPFVDDLRYLASHKKGVFASNPAVDLEQALQLIAADPENVEKIFLGHVYKFWSSYLHFDPVWHLQTLSIPVLYMNGEHDDLDLSKQQKLVKQLSAAGVNITQKIYPGFGHDLKALAKVLPRDILEWAKRNQLISSENKP